MIPILTTKSGGCWYDLLRYLHFDSRLIVKECALHGCGMNGLKYYDVIIMKAIFDFAYFDL